jgi:hypothetical protein
VNRRSGQDLDFHFAAICWHDLHRLGKAPRRSDDRPTALYRSFLGSPKTRSDLIDRLVLRPYLDGVRSERELRKI